MITIEQSYLQKSIQGSVVVGEIENNQLNNNNLWLFSEKLKILALLG